ncbi:MAG: hypothetical protein AAF652_03500 [Cyanobacteria bacterium P01_C01_bin.72]
MRHLLTKICLSATIFLCLTFSSTLGFASSAQAVGVETQPYFIKQIEKDRILSVSPNFRGDLTQTSLLPSLTEISENYRIKATKFVKAEKLNGKQVPGLIVYVETKSIEQPGDMVATKP